MSVLPRPLRWPPVLPLEKGLVLWLPFDSRSGVKAYDRSGKSNHGDLYGPTWLPGKRGSALSFNGSDDYVTVPLTNSLKVTNLTVEAWVKSAVSSQRFHIPDAYTAHTSGFYLGQGVPWAAMDKWRFRSAGADGQGPEINLGDVDVDVWTHLAVTVKGTDCKVYREGAYLRETTLNSVIAATVRDPRFGRNYYDAYGKGVLSEVRIYNRVLSADEIERHYESEILQVRH